MDLRGREDILEMLGGVVEKLGLMSARTRHPLAAVAAVIAVEQLLQQHAADPLHCRAHRELGGPQIEPRAALALCQKMLRYSVGFARRLRLDEHGNFFLSARRSFDSSPRSATGRPSQISSLTATSSGTNA